MLIELIKEWNIPIDRVTEHLPVYRDKNVVYNHLKNLQVHFVDVINGKCQWYGQFDMANSKIELKSCLMQMEKERRIVLAHELAHWLDYEVYRHLGHGNSWATIMMRLGFDPSKYVRLKENK